MKALVLEDVGKLEYKEVVTPVPGKGEVLVKVCAAGICGSDIPRAYKDGAHNMPLIIGHEFSGCVEDVGEGVSHAWKGKRTGIFPLIPCGKCTPCTEKHYEMCRDYSYLGSRRDGGFAEYVTVPEWNLTILPENVSYEAAAMLEPMAVAVHAMRTVTDQTGDMHDKTVVVCGLGTIGTLLVMFLLDSGYRDICVIGNKDFQKKTMKQIGIQEDRYCDSRCMDPLRFIMEYTGGKGADVFFECVGRNDTVSLGVGCTAPGGRICLVGNPHSDMTLDKNVYWKILRNQIRITGTWNSSFLGNGSETDDWHYVLERIAGGGISPEQLITQRFSLDRIIKGFEIMRDRTEDYIKVMYSLTV